jgi:hypothetical protein
MLPVILSEATEEVYLNGVEICVARAKRQRRALIVREKLMADWKTDLQILEAGINHTRLTLVVNKKPYEKFR